MSKSEFLKAFDSGKFFDPNPLFSHIGNYGLVGAILIAGTLANESPMGVPVLIFSLILFVMNMVRGVLQTIAWCCQKGYGAFGIGASVFAYICLVFLLGVFLLTLTAIGVV